MNPGMFFREVLESHQFRCSDTDSVFGALRHAFPAIFIYV